QPAGGCKRTGAGRLGPRPRLWLGRRPDDAAYGRGGRSAEAAHERNEQAIDNVDDVDDRRGRVGQGGRHVGQQHLQVPHVGRQRVGHARQRRGGRVTDELDSIGQVGDDALNRGRQVGRQLLDGGRHVVHRARRALDRRVGRAGGGRAGGGGGHRTG